MAHDPQQSETTREEPGDDWQQRKRLLLDAAQRHMIRYGGDFVPLVIERASGSYIYETSGRAILDFTSGQMCATLGHNHPSVIAAIEQCCERVMHLFSWMIAPPAIDLCRELAKLRLVWIIRASFPSTK